MTGVVRHWNSAGAYGKITGFDKREYFAHVLELVDVLSLRPGQRVDFRPSDDDPRGPAAEDVHVLEPRAIG